jgi:hypothetical protein
VDVTDVGDETSSRVDKRSPFGDLYLRRADVVDGAVVSDSAIVVDLDRATIGEWTFVVKSPGICNRIIVIDCAGKVVDSASVVNDASIIKSNSVGEDYVFTLYNS